MYSSSLMLMALYEDRVRDHLGRRPPHPVRRALLPGRASSHWTRSWATRAGTALRARSMAGVASAGAGTGVRP